MLMVFSIISCSDDKKEVIQFETSSIESVILQAEILIENSEEAMKPGYYMPGAKEELQIEIDKALIILNSPKSQEEIKEATQMLQNSIDLFQTKLLKGAIPYIHQKAGTYIKISDNIKYTISSSFTMEVDCYILDLNQLGYSNNLFSCEQMGPDNGFGVRYFSDGHVELVVGDGSWKSSKSIPDVMKVGEWMKVSLTSTSNTHKVYVNGIEVLSLDHKHVLASNASLVVGNGYIFNDRVVNAMVKNVRVWNTSKTGEEISENLDKDLSGSEADLAAYFPMTIDLGDEFKDINESYTATFTGKVELMYDGNLPEIILDYTELDNAIQEAEELKPTIIEGTNEGDYPIGTKESIQALIDNGKAARVNVKWQKDVDKETKNIKESLEVIKDSNSKPTLPPTGKYSAVFGGGPFYSGGDAVINDMRNSGFTTAILWTIHIEEDGSMIFNDKAVINQNGEYVGDPNWGKRLAKLLEAPTTVDRIELGIGAWGSKSWENIKKLIDAEGTGSETKLFKALKKLKEITGATAINYDDEYTYDVESTVQFSLMLDELGLKVSLCPYTQTAYWQSVYQKVEAERQDVIDRVYLQCYAGGAGNNPSAWNQYFGDIDVSMGLWCKNGNSCSDGDSPSEIETKLNIEKDNIAGGFIWLYDDIKSCSEYGKTQAYATAINNALK